MCPHPKSGKTLYDLKMVELNSITIKIEGYLSTNIHIRGNCGEIK